MHAYGLVSMWRARASKLGAVGANTLVGLKPWVIACGSSQCTNSFGEFVLNGNFGLVLLAGHLIC